MNKKDLLLKKLDRASELAAKGTELTDEEVTEANALVDEIASLKAEVAAADATAKRLAGLARADVHETTGTGDATGTLGERFVASDSYKSFRETNPSGVSKGTPINIAAKGIGFVRKADPNPLSTSGVGNVLPTRLPGIDDLAYRRPTTFLDLITTGVASSASLQYRQLVSVTSNAGIVGEAKTSTGTDMAGGLKPLSTLTTQTKTANAFTYADGIEITNQELSDDGALVTLIDGILRQNVDLEKERVILSGAGTDDEPAGILHTTGVLAQAFDTDAITTIRKAKTLLSTTSNTISQAVVLNPEDDEAFDLAQDAQKRYYGNGPFGVGPSTIWGIPRITSQIVPVGTAIMGDFSQIQLLTLEPMSVLAFNQHKDYAQRNLTYLRAEERSLQLIRQPAKLAVVTIKSA